MLQIKSKLIYNNRVKGNYFHCSLEAPKISKIAAPGQFVNVKLTDAYEPLLRRPFSIHRVSGRKTEILYEVIGKGTEILAQKRPGDYLDIIGPLGNGFDYRLLITDYRLPILVAGGMGVAPLLFLAQKIKQDYSKFNLQVLLGAKIKAQLLCAEEFKKLGCKVKIATDDGSKGFKGKVTDLLKNILRDNEITKQRKTIYACGPRPMLEEISRISKSYKISTQVSLEEHMACGIGACLGCVVNTKEGFKRVCKEGPVFSAKEIIW